VGGPGGPGRAGLAAAPPPARPAAPDHLPAHAAALARLPCPAAPGISASQPGTAAHGAGDPRTALEMARDNPGRGLPAHPRRADRARLHARAIHGGADPPRRWHRPCARRSGQTGRAFLEARAKTILAVDFCLYRFKTQRGDAELRLGMAIRLRHYRGSCLSVCCI
jgi:hypothetical protein